MKRVVRFHEMPPEGQREAVRRVANCAVKRAEYCGEIWLEDARTLAARCRFHLLRGGSIWSVALPQDIPVVPGTAFVVSP